MQSNLLPDITTTYNHHFHRWTSIFVGNRSQMRQICGRHSKIFTDSALRNWRLLAKDSGCRRGLLWGLTICQIGCISFFILIDQKWQEIFGSFCRSNRYTCCILSNDFACCIKDKCMSFCFCISLSDINHEYFISCCSVLDKTTHFLVLFPV